MKPDMIRGLEQSLIGTSSAIRGVRELIVRAAPLPIPVLVLGETGTGKELVARALHTFSGRSGELIACNIAAVSETLFEDALFGHERGAFSGADCQTDGLIARADGGSLFLDEICALPIGLQAKLLRVVELGEYSRVGSTRVRLSRFRLVSAANQSLSRLVGQGVFRDDLAHRLRGTVICLPPLRDRLSDIPELLQHFAKSDEALRGRTIGVDAIDELQGFHWPGNVRQLRHVMSQAAVLAREQRIDACDVRSAIGTLQDHPMPLPIGRERKRHSLQELLDEHADVETVAALLGRDPSTVYRHMRHLGIAPPKRLSARVNRASNDSLEPQDA